MKTCLIIDTETNLQQELVELGWVYYSIESHSMIACGSQILRSKEAIRDQSRLIHRIPDNLDNGDWWEGDKAIDSFLTTLQDADYVVCHNKEFDKQVITDWYDNSLGYNELEWKESALSDTEWLCTYEDFNFFPKEYLGSKSLIGLAQLYGVGISQTHRAIYDCLLIAEVFNRVDDLTNHFQIAVKRLEKVTLIAQVNYEQKELAKNKGFKWFPEQKQWRITIPVIEADQFINSINEFTVYKLEKDN